MPEKASRKTLSRQAARKCAGKGVSRHRGLPRATLSTITPLQSRREDILRQHFAKFYHSHPERSSLLILNNLPVILYRPTPSSRTWSSRTLHLVIPSLPPLHPELIPFMRLQLSGEHVCVRRCDTIYCPAQPHFEKRVLTVRHQCCPIQNSPIAEGIQVNVK